MNVLIVVVVALACLATVVLLGFGMMLDARARRQREARRDGQAPRTPQGFDVIDDPGKRRL